MKFIIGVMLVIIFFPILFQLGVFALVGIGYVLYYAAIPAIVIFILWVFVRVIPAAIDAHEPKTIAARPAPLTPEQITKEWAETLERTRKQPERRRVRRVRAI